ncbi:GTP pyrophosphokinase family protein [Fructobacillus sp. M2-14]|uniref:GTP pyrophosphokinase family protein n=1 Tax=Fructobacillus broussonetiae TaxID=2713173 RepID=A0ABS5R092_9LACO|nr:GTP pyrophosphokinase family protein [Fructobacillus broussonetiae]MBS9338863.1 GTP pyrophosphokinase family protein [Fructobacillus broussonetiae]
MEWQTFFEPYEQAVSELKAKLGYLKHGQLKNGARPVEAVTGRVKSQASIEEKIVRRHLHEDRLALDLQDIAGLRIMTKYIEDIYTVVEWLRKRTDFTILEERDYVVNAKPSGYRSYHMVIEYPVQLYSGEKKVLAEIQIRTMGMNFWATIEHDLRYKHGDIDEEMAKKLTEISEQTFALEQEISDIRG